MIVGGMLAGGIGSRLKTAAIPKQFLEIDGVPIIVRSLRAFATEKRIACCVIAMNPQWMEYCDNLLRGFEVDMSRIHLIHGGAERFSSMQNIVQFCADMWGEKTAVIIHDCARPFVSKRILADNIDMLKQFDMVTTSLPTIDTVLLSNDGRQSSEVPDRSKVFLDQGPQTLVAGDFLDLVRTTPPEKLQKYMEAGRLYLENQKRVGIVTGDRMNFKITTEFDLRFAEYLLQTQRGEGYGRIEKCCCTG